MSSGPSIRPGTIGTRIPQGGNSRTGQGSQASGAVGVSSVRQTRNILKWVSVALLLSFVVLAFTGLRRGSWRNELNAQTDIGWQILQDQQEPFVNIRHSRLTRDWAGDEMEGDPDEWEEQGDIENGGDMQDEDGGDVQDEQLGSESSKQEGGSQSSEISESSSGSVQGSSVSEDSSLSEESKRRLEQIRRRQKVMHVPLERNPMRNVTPKQLLEMYSQAQKSYPAAAEHNQLRKLQASAPDISNVQKSHQGPSSGSASTGQVSYGQPSDRTGSFIQPREIRPLASSPQTQHHVSSVEKVVDKSATKSSLGPQIAVPPVLSKEDQAKTAERARASHGEGVRNAFDTITIMIERYLYDKRWQLDEDDLYDLDYALKTMQATARLAGHQIPDECGTLANMRFPAGDILQMGWDEKASSAAECCDLCHNYKAKGYRPRCNGWAYCGGDDCRDKKGECWLLSQRHPASMNITERDPNWVSGLLAAWAGSGLS